VIHSAPKPAITTPLLLAEAPELALLEIAYVVLHQLNLSLLAVHPTLMLDDEGPPIDSRPPSLHGAESLLASIARTTARLRRYDRAVRSALEPSWPPVADDDIPF